MAFKLLFTRRGAWCNFFLSIPPERVEVRIDEEQNLDIYIEHARTMKMVVAFFLKILVSLSMILSKNILLPVQISTLSVGMGVVFSVGETRDGENAYSERERIIQRRKKEKKRRKAFSTLKTPKTWLHHV